LQIDDSASGFRVEATAQRLQKPIQATCSTHVVMLTPKTVRAAPEAETARMPDAGSPLEPRGVYETPLMQAPSDLWGLFLRPRGKVPMGRALDSISGSIPSAFQADSFQQVSPLCGPLGGPPGPRIGVKISGASHKMLETRFRRPQPVGACGGLF
jgi:hypothetical protein